MEAREFRIGNIVFDSIGNEFMKITGLSDTRIEADFIAGPSDERNERFAKGGKFQIAPIPLTPEILEKCGFVITRTIPVENSIPVNVYGFDEDDGFGFELEDEKYKPDGNHFYFNKLGAMPDVSVSYLHDLQNLYFSLTGEELEVKL